MVSALVFSWGWREQMFLSWAGLRGAVPIVVATIPLANGLVGGQRIFDIVFVLVVVYTPIQGPTLPLVAQKLRLTEAISAVDLAVDAAPLDTMNADLLQLRIPTGSHLHGVTVDELRLPQSATLTLVVRSGRSVMPEHSFRLRADDQLLIVVAGGMREVVEARLLAIHHSGRLAGWVAPSSDGAPVGWVTRFRPVLR